MHKEFNYNQEFESSLERELHAVEKYGNKILCVILFGSLTNKPPRMNGDGLTLKTDADLLIIVKDDKRGGSYNNRKLEFSYMDRLGGKPASRFADHIPNAEIIIQSVSAIKAGMDYVINQCKKAADVDYLPLQRSDTTILQAIIDGII